MMTDRQPVSRDGTFNVHANPAQMYEVRVVTNHGNRITSDHVQFRQGQPVEIRMPKTAGEAVPPGGPISARRLAHKPAKSVRKLVQQSQDLAEEGHIPESAARLEKALSADPNWFEAWNNLGTRRMQMHQYKESAEAFRHAVEIDPNNATVQSNLGLALLFLREPVAAEEAARVALKLEPGAPRALYVAGLALLQQNKNTSEGLANLHESAKVLPRALLATAEWHCRHNDLDACAGDLKVFLRTPRGNNHDAAEKWLSEVKKHIKRAD